MEGGESDTWTRYAYRFVRTKAQVPSDDAVKAAMGGEPGDYCWGGIGEQAGFAVTRDSPMSQEAQEHLKALALSLGWDGVVEEVTTETRTTRRL